MFQNNADLNEKNTNSFQSNYRILEEASDGIYSTFKTQYEHSSTTNNNNNNNSNINNSKSLEFLAQDLLSDSDKYDEFDLGGTNSDTSSLLQLPVFDINNQNIKQTVSKIESKEKKTTNKKRKKNDDTIKQEKIKTKKNKPNNQRRNIKKIFTEEKLNESTLRALNEEKERIQRLTNLNDDLPVQINELEINKDLLNSSNINNCTSSIIDKSSDQSICVIEDDINISVDTTTTTIINNNNDINIINSNITNNQCHHQQKQQQQQYLLSDQKKAYFANYNANFYQNLLANNNKQSIPPPPPPPHPINIKEIDLEAENFNNNNNEQDDDIIECSKEEDDDCRIISESERQQDEQAISKQKLRGIHMNDEKNVPNAIGQVLVNVNHSAEDDDVYLLPYLSKNVKPHQVGGIRFMYDNIVESLTRIKDKTVGFGCILAHAMGLGKTLQVISFIEVFLRCTQSKRVLCIVPINTIQNWQSEFNNWLPENGQQKLDNDTIINYRRPFKVYMINDFSRTIKQRTEVICKFVINQFILYSS
jgi:SNF2 family DNA or RNA helicase